MGVVPRRHVMWSPPQLPAFVLAHAQAQCHANDDSVAELSHSHEDGGVGTQPSAMADERHREFLAGSAHGGGSVMRMSADLSADLSADGAASHAHDAHAGGAQVGTDKLRYFDF